MYTYIDVYITSGRDVSVDITVVHILGSIYSITKSVNPFLFRKHFPIFSSNLVRGMQMSHILYKSHMQESGGSVIESFAGSWQEERASCI